MYERHGDALYAPPLEPFSKGQKRRVANAVNQVLLGFEAEKQSQREAEMAKHLPKVSVPRSIKRKTGFKIMEVFTWTCLLSTWAHSIGLGIPRPTKQLWTTSIGLTRTS